MVPEQYLRNPLSEAQQIDPDDDREEESGAALLQEGEVLSELEGVRPVNAPGDSDDQIPEAVVDHKVGLQVADGKRGVLHDAARLPAGRREQSLHDLSVTGDVQRIDCLAHKVVAPEHRLLAMAAHSHRRGFLVPPRQAVPDEEDLVVRQRGAVLASWAFLSSLKVPACLCMSAW